VLVYNAPDDWRARALDDVSTAVLDGAVRIGAEVGLPVHHFALADTAAAHQAVEDGLVGKVVIDVAE
jgi:NADPH2:quinone reductase